jgi:hypothetical protein
VFVCARACVCLCVTCLNVKVPEVCVVSGRIIVWVVPPGGRNRCVNKSRPKRWVIS